MFQYPQKQHTGAHAASAIFAAFPRRVSCLPGCSTASDERCEQVPGARFALPAPRSCLATPLSRRPRMMSMKQKSHVDDTSHHSEVVSPGFDPGISDLQNQISTGSQFFAGTREGGGGGGCGLVRLRRRAYEFSLVEHTMRKPVSRALEWCAPRAKTRKRHSATGAVVPRALQIRDFPG